MSSSTVTPQPFNFEGHQVRTLMFETGLTWWVLNDVCESLGLTNSRMVAQRMEADEVSQAYVTDSLGRKQETTIINEAGLYRLIMCSRKPIAKRFQRWVTHEVLPQIRRTGGYIPQAESPAETMARAVLIAQRTIKQQERQLAAQEPKVLFADAVSASHTDILVGDLAKILKGNGVDIGGTRLFQWMREHGWLMKAGSAKNMPTQRAMDMGLFRVKETTVVHADGHTTISKTPKVTGKGQAFFISKFLGPGSLEVAA